MTNEKKDRMVPKAARALQIGLCFGLGLIFVSAGAGAQLLPPKNAQIPVNDSSAQGGVNAFKAFAQYPPDNMAIDGSNWDLLHPGLVESQPLVMMPKPVLDQLASLTASGATRDDIRRAVTVPHGLPLSQFEMNKTILAGTKDQLVARLTVLPQNAPPGSGSAILLPFQITNAELVGDPRFGSPRLGAVPFSCEAGGTACTLTWQAPAAEKKHWGSMTLLVTATVQGFPDSLVARHDFYSSPITAGRFTGKFSDRLVDGSLVVDVGVEVHQHLMCFVSANLFSADQALPTHHVERRLVLDQSTKIVPLTFFGKIFRDYGYEGVFQLQHLQARCTNLPYPAEWALDPTAHRADLEKFWQGPQPESEPAHIYFEANTLTFTTSKYANGQFSPLEWQSVDKTRKLAMYQEAAKARDNPEKAAQKLELQKQLDLTH
jgi:hypothetical protein